MAPPATAVRPRQRASRRRARSGTTTSARDSLTAVSRGEADARRGPGRCGRRRRRRDRAGPTPARSPRSPRASSDGSAPRRSRESTRRMSASSPSQVPCQSSPSTQVTPVTNRFDSIVRRIAPVCGIDLVDLPVAVLPDPERAFRPGQPRVTPAARGRDRRQDLAGRRIDLVDAFVGDLEEVLAVEGRPRVAGDVEGAHRLAVLRIEGLQPLAARRTRPSCRRS